jgi:hypothetical protein
MKKKHAADTANGSIVLHYVDPSDAEVDCPVNTQD